VAGNRVVLWMRGDYPRRPVSVVRRQAQRRWLVVACGVALLTVLLAQSQFGGPVYLLTGAVTPALLVRAGSDLLDGESGS
jgi:hypothetical protein